MRYWFIMAVSAPLTVAPNYIPDEGLPSNCFPIGGGSQIERLRKCIGCDYDGAYSCLERLRENKDGLLLMQECDIASLTIGAQQECCARYASAKRKDTLVDGTGGYPITLGCLKRLGCEDAVLYERLVAECQSHGCEAEIACEPDEGKCVACETIASCSF